VHSYSLESKQERSVLREKELLQFLSHPFILDLVSSFQDATNLYLGLPLIQGGELFNVVEDQARKTGSGLKNNDAAFYAAGIIEALGHFHHRHMAYRYLKLENVMIDVDGYTKIVDLVFAKVIVDKSYTFGGTPEYLAPEIITISKGHNHAVDYWSFGVLLYELLAGRSPFNKPGIQPMDILSEGWSLGDVESWEL
jgi:serine/threonine protein kinase